MNLTITTSQECIILSSIDAWDTLEDKLILPKRIVIAIAEKKKAILLKNVLEYHSIPVETGTDNLLIIPEPNKILETETDLKLFYNNLN